MKIDDRGKRSKDRKSPRPSFCIHFRRDPLPLSPARLLHIPEITEIKGSAPRAIILEFFFSSLRREREREREGGKAPSMERIACRETYRAPAPTVIVVLIKLLPSLWKIDSSFRAGSSFHPITWFRYLKQFLRICRRPFDRRVLSGFISSIDNCKNKHELR